MQFGLCTLFADGRVVATIFPANLDGPNGLQLFQQGGTHHRDGQWRYPDAFARSIPETEARFGLISACIDAQQNGKIEWPQLQDSRRNSPDDFGNFLKFRILRNNFISLGWSSHMMVLIVDDEEETVDYLESLLCSAFANVDVFRAFNGAHALELCSKVAFDLICTDIAMPVMDGLDFATNLRNAEGPNQDTGIILISGVVDQTPSECDMFQGMFFLSKPFLVATFLMTASLASKVPRDQDLLKAGSADRKKTAGSSD